MNQELSLCPKCKKTFGGKLVRNKHSCPLCNNSLMAVDEHMVPLVLDFGEHIESCCSGHMYNNNAYVEFRKISEKEISLPKGYSIEEIRRDIGNDYNYVLSWHVEGEDNSWTRILSMAADACIAYEILVQYFRGEE